MVKYGAYQAQASGFQGQIKNELFGEGEPSSQPTRVQKRNKQYGII